MVCRFIKNILILSLFFILLHSEVLAVSVIVDCSGTVGSPTAVDEVSLAGDDVTFSDSGGDGYCELDNSISAASVVIGDGAGGNVILTHPSEGTSGVAITTTGDLTINSGSSINVDAKGCGNSKSPDGSNVCASAGTGTGTGEGSDGVNNIGASGGGYGGVGGKGNTGYAGGNTYGSSTLPSSFGSGGGDGYLGDVGGAGGGLVNLDVGGTFTHNGTISANGEDVTSGNGGGGSGGSINIDAVVMNGSGSFSATGGDGGPGQASSYGGGGSGGRIAIEYDSGSYSFDSNDFQLLGGSAGGGAATDGTRGTGYVKNTTDNSISIYYGFTFDDTDYSVTTWTSDSTATNQYCDSSAISPSISAITLNLAGTLNCTASSVTSFNFSATTAFNVSDSTSITVSAEGADMDFNIPDGDDQTWNDVTITGGPEGLFTIDDAISITLNGASNINANAQWTALTSLILSNTSAINADSKGCYAYTYATNGEGPDGSNVCTVTTAGYGQGTASNSNGTAGAGYGGQGGAGSHLSGGRATYGDEQAPVLFGSSGGNQDWNIGGTGGGFIRLNVTGDFTFNGVVSVDGGDGNSLTGGGSGGSIYITAGSLSGTTGSVSADGGDGIDGTGDGGGGGGGRISITGIDNTTFMSGLTAAGVATGGTGPGAASNGSNGTLYTLLYTVPVTPSISSPLNNSYNNSANPTLSGSTYSSNGKSHTSTDWKITTDSGGSNIVWSKDDDATNLESIVVNTTNGSFSGALAGQTQLATNTTYYAFVRYTNAAGDSSWSSAISFVTSYNGSSATQTWHYNDATSNYTYDSNNIEVNDSSNSLARLKDQGGGVYLETPLSALAAWTKYKEVTITNNVGSTLTNYQVRVNVTYDADMQADFDDIRFRSADGSTALNYWLESKTDSTSAVFWVNVPSLAASTDTVIRMYYGNNSASSGASAGSSVFDFFDDFETFSGWSSYGSGVVSQSATQSYGGSNSALKDTNGDPNGATKSLGFTQSRTNGFIFEFFGYRSSGTNYDRVGIEANDNSGYGFAYDHGGQNIFVDERNSSASATTNVSQSVGSDIKNTWYIGQLIATSSSLQSKILDSSYSVTASTNSFSDTTVISFTQISIRGGYPFYVDNLRIRKYAATEPSLSMGSEKSLVSYDDVKIFPAASGSHPAYTDLYGFTETLGSGNQGSVKYQISKDGTNWYYYNGSNWVAVSDDVTDNNTASEMNSYLPAFVDDVGTGDLYIKAFLISDSTQKVELDSIAVTYQQPVVTFLTTSQSVSESVGSVSATVNLNATLGSDVVIPYTVTGTAANGGVDHNLANGSLTISSGGTSGVISFNVTNDVLDEVSETVIITLGTPSSGNAGLGATTVHTVTIADDDNAPTVSFSTGSSAGSEANTSVLVPVSLSSTSGKSVSVDYAVNGGTASGSGTDYTLTSGTLTFSAGEVTKNISVSVNNDDLDEDNETIAISINNPSNATLGSTASHIYTIADDDVTPALSVADVNVNENAGTATVTVSMTSKSENNISVDYTTSDNTAEAGKDYTTKSGTLTWSSGQTGDKTFTVNISDDALDENNETITVTLSNNSGGSSISDASGTITINDNDVSPDIGFNSASSSGSESTTSLSLPISLSAVSGRDVSIDYAVSGGTATGGATDYTLASGTLTISAGSTSGNVNITINNDQIDENDETIEVTLSNKVNAANITTTLHTYTITDDDMASVTVTESGGSVNVTEGGSTDTYTMVLDSEPTANVVITLATGTQLTADVSTLTFTSGNWNVVQTITVTAINDDVAEGNHTATFSHSVSSTDTNYDQITVNNVIVNLTDNDTAGVSVTESSGATLVDEDLGNDTYTVVLTSEPFDDVKIGFSVGNNQVTVSPSLLTFTSANWDTPQTVTITGVDDDVVEGSHTESVTHTASSTDSGYNGIAIQTVTVSLTDDDSAGVTVSENDNKTEVGGDKDVSDTYQILLTSQPVGNVTIAMTHDEKVSVTPVLVTFTPANWNVGQEITVSAANEISETVNSTITHAITATADSYYPVGMSIPSLVVKVNAVERSENGEGEAGDGEEGDDGGGEEETAEEAIRKDCGTIQCVESQNYSCQLNIRSCATEKQKASYEWQQLSGQSVDIENINSFTTKIKLGENHSKTVKLQLSESTGLVINTYTVTIQPLKNSVTSNTSTEKIVAAAYGEQVTEKKTNTLRKWKLTNGLEIRTRSTNDFKFIIVEDVNYKVVRVLIGDPMYENYRGRVVSINPTEVMNNFGQMLDLDDDDLYTVDGVSVLEGIRDYARLGYNLVAADLTGDGVKEVIASLPGMKYGWVWVMDLTLDNLLYNLRGSSHEELRISQILTPKISKIKSDLVLGVKLIQGNSSRSLAVDASESADEFVEIENQTTAFDGLVVDELEDDDVVVSDSGALYFINLSQSASFSTQGDVNQDGVIDFVFADSGECKIYIVYGSEQIVAGSTLSDNTSILCDSQYAPSSLSVGDVTGDGYNDVIIGVNQDRKIIVMPGQNDGINSESTVTVTNSGAKFGEKVLLSDTDQDGIDDIITDQDETSSVIVNMKSSILAESNDDKTFGSLGDASSLIGCQLNIKTDVSNRFAGLIEYGVIWFVLIVFRRLAKKGST